MKVPQYPLANTTELLQQMAERKPTYLGRWDLVSGFHQAELEEADAAKTAFRTHRGLYEYVRLPMGISASPAIFQRLMVKVLQPVLDKGGVYVYINDVGQAANSIDEYVEQIDVIC